MSRASGLFLPALLAAAIALHGQAFADSLGEMASFSVLKNPDPAKLADGHVVAARGQTMKFNRGLAVESCYFVPAPVQAVAANLRAWNPAPHRELKVYVHVDMPGKPSAGDFRDIKSAPRNSAVSSFVAATEKLDSGRPQLLMSVAEAARAPKDASSGRKGVIPDAVAEFWGRLLLDRALAFSTGGISSQPPYHYGGADVAVSGEINRLVAEAPRVRDRFSGLISAARLSGGGRSPLNPMLYWEMFDVEGRAAVCLGAFLGQQKGDGWQGVDVQYYSSSGFFALLTFYEMWPIQLDSRQGTLVWRGDLLSSPELGGLRGVERTGSAVAMMKDIQKVIGAFQKDAAGR